MNNHTARTALGGAALAAVLLLSACGSGAGTPGASSPTPSASPSAAPTESQDPALLQLNESLKETLWDKYSEDRIVETNLLVAVTD